MKRVKVSYNGLAWPLERQTPGTSGIWGDCAFHINEDVNECDYWIVYEGLAGKEESICPADGMVFITGEPPAVRRYDPFFLDQFSKVVTCQRRIGHPGAIFSQQALPWFVGVRYDLTKKGRKDDWSVTMDYDALSRSEVKKDRTLSMMTSGKRSTSGHRKRLDFAHRLEKEFGSDVDVFISGRDSVPDKWEVISRYRYHIAIENSTVNDYWTEKLSDSFLGMAMPIYHGCPNLSSYFSPQAYVPIDINRPDASMRAIEKAISDDRYKDSLDSIAKSKELVLNRYNIFPTICDLISKMPATRKKELNTLEPEKQSHWNIKSRVRFRKEQITGLFDHTERHKRT